MWSSRDPISKQVPVTSVFFTFCGQTHHTQMRYHFLAIYRDTASLTATLPIRTRDRIELDDPYMYEGGNKWPNEQVSGVTWAGQSPLMMHPIHMQKCKWPCHTYLSCWKLEYRISALSTHVFGTCFDLSTLSWPTMCFPWNVNFDLWELCRDGRHKHSLSNSVWLYNCFHFQVSVFHKSLHLRRLFDQLPCCVFDPRRSCCFEPDLRKVAKKKISSGGLSHFFVGNNRKAFLWEHLGTFKSSCQETNPRKRFPQVKKTSVAQQFTVLVKQPTIAGQE